MVSVVSARIYALHLEAWSVQGSGESVDTVVYLRSRTYTHSILSSRGQPHWLHHHITVIAIIGSCLHLQQYRGVG